MAPLQSAHGVTRRQHRHLATGNRGRARDMRRHRQIVWQSLDFLDWVSWVIRWRGIWRAPVTRWPFGRTRRAKRSSSPRKKRRSPAHRPKQVAEQADFISPASATRACRSRCSPAPTASSKARSLEPSSADASTISPTASRGHRRKAGQGIHFLDAPCTGSTPGAINATLTFHDRRRPGRVRKNEAISGSHGQAVLTIAAARVGPAGQAHAEPDPRQLDASIQRRPGAEHQGRHRARS
jgi:hypothetical protein